MKVDYINPFIESVCELFSTTFAAQVKRIGVAVCDGDSNPRDLVAIIGLGGEAQGAVALCFPAATALAMVGRLVGSELHIVDDTVSDGLAELVNIVAGAAKARFADTVAEPITLSMPTVIRGGNFKMNQSSQAPWLDVLFTSDLGPFNLRVTFELENAKGVNA